MNIFSRLLTSHILILLALTTSAQSQEKIKIGVSVPLSGVAASYGTDIKNALVFANEKIANNAYELIIEDDQCLDKEAVTIAHKLVDIDQVKYVLGFGCSGTVLASAPIYEKAGVIVIASGTGAPLISNAGDYIFRTKPSLNIAGQKLAEDMRTKFKKVGVLTEETAYCQGLTDALIQSAESTSLKVINENFLPQTADFRSTLLRLKAKGSEAIFINPQGDPTYITIYKQLRSMNWNIPVYGTFQPSALSFLDAFGNKADGIVFADVPFNEDTLNENGLKIYREFTDRFGSAKSGEHFITFSYLAFNTLHEAILSKENIKDYLYKTKFTGIFDEYSFDKNGDILSDKITYGLKIIKNGAPTKYK